MHQSHHIQSRQRQDPELHTWNNDYIAYFSMFFVNNFHPKVPEHENNIAYSTHIFIY